MLQDNQPIIQDTNLRDHSIQPAAPNLLADTQEMLFTKPERLTKARDLDLDGDDEDSSEVNSLCKQWDECFDMSDSDEEGEEEEHSNEGDDLAEERISSEEDLEDVPRQDLLEYEIL